MQNRKTISLPGLSKILAMYKIQSKALESKTGISGPTMIKARRGQSVAAGIAARIAEGLTQMIKAAGKVPAETMLGILRGEIADDPYLAEPVGIDDDTPDTPRGDKTEQRSGARIPPLKLTAGVFAAGAAIEVPDAPEWMIEDYIRDHGGRCAGNEFTERDFDALREIVAAENAAKAKSHAWEKDLRESGHLPGMYVPAADKEEGETDGKNRSGDAQGGGGHAGHQRIDDHAMRKARRAGAQVGQHGDAVSHLSDGDAGVDGGAGPGQRQGQPDKASRPDVRHGRDGAETLADCPGAVDDLLTNLDEIMITTTISVGGRKVVVQTCYV